VASRQSKQVRLLDRQAIPSTFSTARISRRRAPHRFRRLCCCGFNTAPTISAASASGRVAVFAASGSEKLLRHESGIRDLAVDEEVEIDLGQVRMFK